MVHGLTSQLTVLSPQWSKLSSTTEGGSFTRDLLLGAICKLVTLLNMLLLLLLCTRLRRL